MIDGQLRPILDWARARSIDPRNPPLGIVFMPDLEGFKSGALADEARMLLGPAQEGWLKTELETSRKQRTIWQVLGNQTLMARINAPDLSNLPAPVVATLEKLQPGASRLLPLTRFNPPLSLDSWDGYPAQRARVYAMIAEAQANAIVITGDSHSAWANELTSDDGKSRAGVEFGATSITSPGFGDWFSGAEIDFAQAMPKANPDVKWHDATHRGFTVLTLTKTEAKADFFIVSDVRTKQYTVAKTASFSVRADDRGKTGALKADQ
jgi:alkaline phosphatase D